MKRKDNRLFLFIPVVFILFSISCFYCRYISNSLPEFLYIYENDEAKINVNTPVMGTVYYGDEKLYEAVNFNDEVLIKSGNVDEYEIRYKLFGIFPIANSKLKVVEPKEVYVGGFQLGIYMKLDGVLVERLETISTLDKGDVLPANVLLTPGDYIVMIDGQKVTGKRMLAEKIKNCNGENISLVVRRKGELINVLIQPIKDLNGEYKIGAWLKDDTQGVGTVTYIDKDNNIALLGHGISYDENNLLEIQTGGLFRANIVSIVQGMNGKPGELLGTINYKAENFTGLINENKNSGVFGQVSTDFVEEYDLKSINTCASYDVHKGEAYINFYYKGEMKQYEIRVDNIRYSDTKNLTFTVVSDELLSLTNGIVQGMSGCPIIQDGKLIGAVTHVFIDDSTKGYGIFIDNMLGH